MEIKTMINGPTAMQLESQLADALKNGVLDIQVCEFCKCKTNQWNWMPSGKSVICNACAGNWSNGSIASFSDVPSEGLDSAEDISSPSYRSALSPMVSSHDEMDTRIKKRGTKSRSSNIDSSSDQDSMQLDEDELRRSKRKRATGDSSKRERANKRKKISKTRVGTSTGIHGSTSPSKPHSSDAKKEKEMYYCKYCDTSWPHDHFRNAQQFGAHCSNCSRKRKVKDPQEMTIRERNSRIRRAKGKTVPKKVQTEVTKHTAYESESSSSSEDEIEEPTTPIRKISQNNSYENSDENGPGSCSTAGSRRGSLVTHTVRSSPRFTTRPSGSSSPIRNSTPAKQNDNQPLPDHSVPTQQDLIDDPRSLGGLLMAMEEQLTKEKRRMQVDTVKKTLLNLRQEVNEQKDIGIDHLRLKSKEILQDLDMKMTSSLEAVKLELSSELSFRETRRRASLEDLKHQMCMIEQLLTKGSQQRSSLLDGDSLALKNDLEKMKKEFLVQEKVLNQKYVEVEKSVAEKTNSFKAQLSKEVAASTFSLQVQTEELNNKLAQDVTAWNAKFNEFMQHGVGSKNNFGAHGVPLTARVCYPAGRD